MLASLSKGVSAASVPLVPELAAAETSTGVNPGTQTLSWYDAVSNLCGDDGSSLEQALIFKVQGTPPMIGKVPDDVLDEIYAVINAVELRAPTEVWQQLLGTNRFYFGPFNRLPT